MTSSVRLQVEANVARAGLSTALEELRQSVTTTAITNGAMTFAKEGSTAVAQAAVDRAMASPVAAMMIGAGLVMLMVGDKKVGSAVGSLVEQGKSAVKSATETASSTASSLADRVSGTTDQATGQAQAMLADGQQQAKDVLAKGREQGEQVLEQAEQLIEQGRGRFEQFAQEQPILVAALGVALGAALGASLPITKVEQQYLADPARKVASKAGEVARKTADTVTDKLAGQNVAHKVGEVVEAVSSTVTQGFSRS
jgi:hypothetical protein